MSTKKFPNPLSFISPRINAAATAKPLAAETNIKLIIIRVVIRLASSPLQSCKFVFVIKLTAELNESAVLKLGALNKMFWNLKAAKAIKNMKKFVHSNDKQYSFQVIFFS